MNSTATAQLNNFCRAALRNSFTLSPLLHATSLTAMRRHGVLGPLGHGSQAPPLPHCILPYGADARVHAEHGVPGTRSCGLFCLSAERQLALSGLAPFAALCAAPAERQLALSGLAPFAAICAAPAERQLALSGLAPFAALCAAPAERQLALSGLAPFRPRAAPAERQLCHPALSALCAAPAELQLCLSGLATSSAHSWHCRGSRLWRSDSSAAPSTGAGH